MKSMYDWIKWFEKDSVTLKYGKDFSCPTMSMTQQIRNAAYRNGYKVSLQVMSNKDIKVRTTYKPTPVKAVV